MRLPTPRIPFLPGVLLLLVSSVLGSCVFILNDGYRAEASDDYNFSTSGVSKVRIETYNGSLSIAATDGNTVECTAKFYATGKSQASADERVDKMLVTGQSDDGVLLIKVPTHPDLGTNNVGAALTLQIPAGVDLELYTSNGRVEMNDRFDHLDVRTSNGSIVALAGDGGVTVRTSNGTVRLDAVGDGPVRVRSSNGSILYQGHSADMELVSSNGNVTATLPDQWSGKGYLHSSNGNITIESSGRLRFSLSGSTSNGKVRIHGPRMLERGADGPMVTAETSNGNITVNHKE